MEITEVKPKVTNNKESMIYYEMCDPVTGEKTAGAITTPIKPSIAKKMPKFQTVIISTLNPAEVVEVLRKGGEQF